MNKKQAIEIRRKLRALNTALTNASLAIIDLDKEEQKILIDPVWEFKIHLNFKMLEFVYAQYPKLRPPPVPPTICSELQWEDVTLPESVSEADIDAIIFSFLTTRQKKTAMVVGQAVRHCREHNLLISDEILAARIGALAELGRIESFGDLRMWGHSEIKLKD